MRWQGRRQSDNIEDRRGSAAPRRVAVGGGIGVLVIAVIAMLMGGDPQALLDVVGQQGAVGAGYPAGAGEDMSATESAQEAELREFLAVVLAETEDVWNALLDGTRTPYREPRMVLFRDAVQSACGSQDAAVGPFYCPGDDSVYLDLGFLEQLLSRFGAAGDFARAYVVAHEVGHHVQNVLGISNQIHARQRGLGPAEANDLSVRLELQADFLAGVWAHHVQQRAALLEQGDIEEALNAASQIGDDTIQRRSQGRVVPESFTHGTSEQRMRWFRRGFETGDLEQRDTFEIADRDL